MRKTKIVCTLGPSTDNPNVLKALFENGMNVARLNFSHGTHEEQKIRADMIKKLREELDLPVALLLDTKGPEIRIGNFIEGKILLSKNDKFTLTTEKIDGDNKKVSVTYDKLPAVVKRGDKILIDDGLIELTVESTDEKNVYCSVNNDGALSNKKSINLPGIKTDMQYVSPKDEQDLLFAIENDFDFIAASFVRTAMDVLDIRKILDNNGGKNLKIISKIESNEGIENIDSILKVSDGIMVARGDLGVEVSFEKIPAIQKMIIKKCMAAGKDVITATQMLDSMIRNPRPTRAEATDVANAVYDGTSAVMLSGETAAGAFPVEALKTMAKIAQTTENDINYKSRFNSAHIDIKLSITNAISHATCSTAHDIGAKAIITLTKSGHTAYMVSKYRPACPIVATTQSQRVRRQLSLTWGVCTVMFENKDTIDELFEQAVQSAKTTNIIDDGDLVVITAGVPLNISGTTNILKVHTVGHVLLQGKGINNLNVCGQIRVCESVSDALKNFEDKEILVVKHSSNELLPLLKRAKAIITEEEGLSSYAAIAGLMLDIPVVTGAAFACDILKTGMTVTIDGDKGIVYSGVTKVL